MAGDVRDLTFRFLGIDAGAGRQFDRIAGKASVTGGALEKVALGAAAAGAAVAVAAVKMAANFQNAVVHLQTDAGESAKNLKMVSDGILNMAGQVGVSAQQLAQGMYYVESAGYHGAAGLQVLKVAAQGAKVGGADLVTMSDALTSALNAYRLPASAAVQVTNEMIGAVSHGKMKMQDLAGSLGSVLPAASAAKIGLDQVLGAIATMTAQGTSADNAATYLRQTILNLAGPTPKAIAEMEGLGLSAIDVQKNLGKRGLTGTLQLLTDQIAKKMGPAGTVLVEKLAKAAKQTKDYDRTTQALRQTATGWVKTITEEKKVGDSVTKTITTLTDKHGVLTKHVATSSSIQQNFNEILAGLSPTEQTAVQALKDMVGGTKNMQAALELTGGNAVVFQQNVKGIADEAKHAGKNVKDWEAIQKTFNQKFDEARYSVGALEIELGNALLPTATKLMDWIDKKGIPDLQKFGHWFADNKKPIEDFGKVLLPILAALEGMKVANKLGSFLGVGGKGGLLGSAASKAAPLPVYVTNWGGKIPGGGPGGGAPVAVGGGAASAVKAAAGTILAGDLVAENVGPHVKVGGVRSGGAVQAFRYGQALGLDNEVKKIQGEYKDLNPNQQAALDQLNPALSAALAPLKKGDMSNANLDALRHVIADAEGAIKMYADQSAGLKTLLTGWQQHPPSQTTIFNMSGVTIKSDSPRAMQQELAKATRYQQLAGGMTTAIRAGF